MEKFESKVTFHVSPSVLYHAWLDSKLHTEMTGGQADCSETVGESFSAWDGYITGKNIELIKDQKIVQTWRTSEFQDDDEDSLLSITFNKSEFGTELILSHSHIPAGQTQYEQGWVDNYFEPMMKFFERN